MDLQPTLVTVCERFHHVLTVPHVLSGVVLLFDINSFSAGGVARCLAMCGSRLAPRMCCSDDCWDLRTRKCRWVNCVDTAVVPELYWAIALITLGRLPEASVFPAQLVSDRF